MKKLLILLSILLVAAPICAAEELVFCGAGINYEVTEALAAAYAETNPGVKITFLPKIGTGAAVKQVTAGKLDFGLMARPLTTNETELGLRYVPYAQGAVAFVVHETVTGVDNLTTEQILGIYSGKINSWSEVGGPNEPITVMSREPEAAAMLMFNSAIDGWNKLAMRDDAIIALTTSENNDNLSFMPFCIGFTDLGSLNSNDLPVRPVAFDGINPNPDNIASGRYPLVSELGFCIKGEPAKKVTKFLDFLKTEQARQILVEYGYTPVL